MKKFLIGFSIVSICLSGCSVFTDSATKEKLEEYETYYGIIYDNTKFIEQSDDFHIALEMAQVEDGSYRYVVVIDDPQVAMYDVVMMAIVDNVPFEETTSMMPSLGIFEDECSLIPGQVNVENGIAKGLAMSGDCREDNVNLQILVQFKNENRDKQTREFFSYHLSTEGYEYQEIEKNIE